MSILKNKRAKVMVLSLIMSTQLGIISHADGVWGVDRVQGDHIYETSAMLSEKFEDYNTAILVNLDNTTADGLSSAALSGAANAPIFAIKKDDIPYEVSSKINNYNIKKVYVIGGESSISQKALEGIYYHDIEIIRLAGNDRISTSYKVAEEVSKLSNINKVFYANAWKGEADTMSASSVSAREKAPIIQTDGKNVPFVENVESYVVGGSSTMSENIVNKTESQRLGGTDRFSTNKRIIQKFYPNATDFYITKAYDLRDAMITSPLANKLNKPIVLVNYGSDKSILKGAKNITAVGNVTYQITEEAHEASRGVTAKPNYNTYKAGTYLVGRDISPGEYLIISNKNDNFGYYEVKNGTSSSDDILENGFASPNAYITVEKGQYLTIQRCTAKIARFNPLPANQTSVKGGVYIVGKDIKSGQYKVETQSGESAYWSISKNSNASNYKLLANGFIEGVGYITVQDGEYLELGDILKATKIK